MLFLLKTPGILVRRRIIPIERPPIVGEVSANLVVEVCRFVSAADPTAVNLSSPYRNRTFFIQVTPQLSSRG
jgi:hypothetical protein